MKKLFLTAIVILFTFVITYSLTIYTCFPVQANSEKLEQQLDKLIIETEDLHGALAGVSIRFASTGKMMYDSNGDTRLRPASGLKLLTAAASLAVLGEDYTFKTEVLTDGEIKWNILNGNVYLKGKGDPSLLIEDFDQLAEEIRKRGVKIIRGNLIGDDTWYDDVRYSTDLPWSDETAGYGAQVSALTVSPDHDFNVGTVLITIESGGEIGQLAKTEVKPTTDYVTIVNHTKTVPKSEKSSLEVKRVHGTNLIKVDGQIPIGSKQEMYVSVWEPTDYSLDLFKQSLKKAGITLIGHTKRGETPYHAEEIISRTSMPLSKILVSFMKLSNNGHADILVKEMGKVRKGEGSWEAGLAVIIEELSTWGVNTDTLVLRDGSGISHVNLIPANELSKLLYAVQDKSWFSAFVHALPVSGINDKMVGGTLSARMKDPFLKGKVRAKTGTISTVSSLSGYVKTKTGENLIFSIILNNLADDSKAKIIEDEIVFLLADF